MDDLETALKQRLAILRHRGDALKKDPVSVRGHSRAKASHAIAKVIITDPHKIDVTPKTETQDIAEKHIGVVKKTHRLGIISKASIRGSLKEAGILNKNGKMINRVKFRNNKCM